MNHRCCRREPVDIPTQLHFSETLSQPARIKNISHGGAYVETRLARRFPVDGIIEIEVSVQKKGKTTRICTQGLVIHHDRQGLGLMFVNESNSFVKVLCKHCRDLREPNGKPLILSA